MNQTLAAWRAAAGDRTSGLLLARIAMEQETSPVVRGGLRWVVRSREAWAAELGCAIVTVDRALAKLKKKGLVLSEVHLVDDKTVAFRRLSRRGLEVAEKVKNGGLA